MARCTPGSPPAQGALREAGEELGLTGADLLLGRDWVDDHGGWSYTTVLATPTGALEPAGLRLNAESLDVAWVPLERPGVPLHPGFAGSLDTLRPLLLGRVA